METNEIRENTDAWFASRYTESVITSIGNVVEYSATCPFVHRMILDFISDFCKNMLDSVELTYRQWEILQSQREEIRLATGRSMTYYREDAKKFSSSLILAKAEIKTILFETQNWPDEITAPLRRAAFLFPSCSDSHTTF